MTSTSESMEFLELAPVSLNQVSPMTQRRQLASDTERPSSMVSEARPMQPAYTNNPEIWYTSGDTSQQTEDQPGQRPGPQTKVTDASPAPVICPNCKQNVMTYLYRQSGTCSYVSCILLALIGCDLGCCLLPFVFDCCKDSVHKCPECHVILGKHKRI